MKPKTDTAETPEDVQAAQRSVIDLILTRACNIALEESGGSLSMLLDRLATLFSAHAVSADGSKATAEALRHIADQIEAGALAHLEGQRTAGQHKPN